MYDGTNDDTRTRLRKDPDLDLTDRLLTGASIGHNKFLIYEHPQQGMQSVLTGSVNWTATGLCGQTNNAVLIDDPAVASQYHEYWRRLRNEQTKLQDQPLRTWARENPFDVSLGQQAGSLRVWFSPNTKKKTKLIAEAFATHVLDVVNHYKWRYKLQDLYRKGKLEEAWQDLEDNDNWQNKYFDSGLLASRDRFVLPG